MYALAHLEEEMHPEKRIRFLRQAVGSAGRAAAAAGSGAGGIGSEYDIALNATYLRSVQDDAGC